MEEVEKILPQHIDYLDRYFDSGVFLCAGRKVPRTGGIIIGDAGSMDEMEAIVCEDPFHIHDVAAFEIIEFAPTRFSTNCEYIN